MNMGRTFVSATLAIALTACGGSDGGSSGNTSGGNTGSSSGGTTSGGTSTGQCSLSARQDWVRSELNEWYLFPDLLDLTVNKAQHTNIDSYIDALVAPARAQNKDRYFTYITSIKEENDLITNGSNASFGLRFALDSSNRLMITEAFEGAPALAAGIDRGSEIVAINGTTVAQLIANGGVDALIAALEPTQRSFTFRTSSTAAQQTVTISKADFSLDPISDRYGVRIFNNGGTKVGYVNLRTFIIQSAGQQLRDAFAQFRAEGVQQVILDLRYNGGGLVSIAELLGDLMAEGHVGQVFSHTVMRASKSVNNETVNFSAQPQAIAASKIAVIGRSGTASASELVTNAFIPYLGANIGLIGANTYGKPVGQIARDREACDDRLRVVAFQTMNADNQGGYYSGLASVMRATCSAGDDLTAPLGDTNEASISVALDYLAGRSCSPIASASAAAGRTASINDGVTYSNGPQSQLLQPKRPSPAQREVPGLF